MKRVLTATAIAVAALTATSVNAIAATPDGSGPWADTVVAADQGPRADGTPVIATRSDPTSALGVAEATDAEGTFFALGFGGEITLGFENNICNAPGPDVGLRLVETTREPYPQELVDVYVSADGTSWALAAEDVDKDAQVSLPDSINVARYVRLVDVSNPDDFAGRPTVADGYDVDGVKALNTNCVAEGKMTGGGFVLDERKVTHGFVLRCDPSERPNHLTVHWRKRQNGSWRNFVFYLTSLDSALCSNDPALDPFPPAAPFDTYQGMGTGKVNRQPGYTAEWTFTDAGEPGSNADTMKVLIKDPGGNVVLDAGPGRFRGNHQAHPGHPAP